MSRRNIKEMHLQLDGTLNELADHLIQCHRAMVWQWHHTADYSERRACLESFFSQMENMVSLMGDIRGLFKAEGPWWDPSHILFGNGGRKGWTAAQVCARILGMLQYEYGVTELAVQVFRDNPGVDVVNSTDRLEMHNMGSRIGEIEYWCRSYNR